MNKPFTTVLESVFNDHDNHTGIYGEHKAWLHLCESCQQTILAAVEQLVTEVIGKLGGQADE